MRYSLLFILLSFVGCTSTESVSQTFITLPYEAIAPTEHDEFAPAISPDGHWVAFVGHHEGMAQIYLFDTVDGTMTNPLPSSHDTFDPKWSPDGRYLAFKFRPTAYVTPVDIYLLDMQTGEQLPVTIKIEDYDVYYTARENVISFQVRNTGNYSTPFVFYQEGYSGGSAVRTSLNASSSHMTMDKTVNFEGFRQTPDSMTANFVHVADDDQRRRIRYYGWSASEENFAWSLDTIRVNEFQFPSESIIQPLFQDRTISTKTDLFIGNQNGDSDLLIHINHDILMGAWSPVDPHLFTFSTYAGLYIADIQTGQVSNILHDRGYIDEFYWSPDGTMIAILSYAKEHAPLIPAELIILPIADASTSYSYSYAVDDFGFRRTLRGRYPRYRYSELQWFPDSDRLLVVYSSGQQYDIGLFSLPTNKSE